MSSNVSSDPRRPSRLLLMGAPGSGKRTQGVTLGQRLEVPSLSTGDLFRSMMCYDSPVAARIRDTVGHGGFVDDATTNAAIDARLESDECADGFLLYGYPRTTSQAAHLDRLLETQGTQLDVVVSLQVPDDVLFERLMGREKQLGRIDDQYETVRPRLALYHEKTEPLLDLYADRGLLVKVDGTGSVRQVTEHIDAALLRRGPALASAGSR